MSHHILHDLLHFLPQLSPGSYRHEIFCCSTFELFIYLSSLYVVQPSFIINPYAISTDYQIIQSTWICWLFNHQDSQTYNSCFSTFSHNTSHSNCILSELVVFWSCSNIFYHMNVYHECNVNVALCVEHFQWLKIYNWNWIPLNHLFSKFLVIGSTKIHLNKGGQLSVLLLRKCAVFDSLAPVRMCWNLISQKCLSSYAINCLRICGVTLCYRPIGNVWRVAIFSRERDWSINCLFLFCFVFLLVVLFPSCITYIFFVIN